MPGDFQMPEATELWVPMKPPTNGPSELAGIGRVNPGVTLAGAQADLDRMAKLQDDLFPKGRGWWGSRAIPLRTQVVGDVSAMLFALFGAAAILLMIACVNAAQLLLARLQSRRHELAIRAALGASTPRIARVLLIEAMLITEIAGALGTLAGVCGVSLVRTAGPSRLPRLADVTFDGRVTAVAIGSDHDRRLAVLVSPRPCARVACTWPTRSDRAAARRAAMRCPSSCGGCW